MNPSGGTRRVGVVDLLRPTAIEVAGRAGGRPPVVEPMDGEEALIRGPRFAPSKFMPPRLGSRLVPRSRLFDALDQGAARRLTLVVGAPGAGKTTLLTSWLSTRPNVPAAWL